MSVSQFGQVEHLPGNAIMKYVANAGWLTVPINIWNLVMTSRLPASLSVDVFWKDIPPVIAYGESVFRLFVVVLPFLMPLRLAERSQRVGAAVYTLGVVVYFLSWLPLVLLPESAWSTSLLGVLAPAFTPLIWTTGIALVGDSLYFRALYRPSWYIALSIVFVGFHVTHTAIVYARGL